MTHSPAVDLDQAALPGHWVNALYLLGHRARNSALLRWEESAAATDDRRALGDLPWEDYDVEVVITVFVPDREIAWTIEGRLKPPLRHVYGYRLEPAGTGVLVTSYYDWSELDPSWQNSSGSFPVVPESALKATLGILDRTVRRRHHAAEL